MKHSKIELATIFDSEGVPMRYETFVTRSSIPFSLVYECVSFLASLKGNPDNDELHVMIDLVVRIFDNQFTKNQLIDGLTSYKGTHELYKQVVSVGSGQNLDDEVEPTEAVQSMSVNGWEDHKENLRKTIKKMVKDGEQTYNDVLNIPFYLVFDDLNTKAKAERKSSMLSAFGQ